MEKNMYMEVFVEKSSKLMGINGNLSSHIGAPEVLNKHKKILQKTHSGTSFSNVDRISTAHFHAPYAPEMHELGTGTVIRESCGWYWMIVCIIKLPSGYVKIAVENDHRNSKFSHWPWWFSIVLLVYQRVRWKRKHERCHWITFQLPCGLRPMIVSSTTTGSGFWTDLACLMISRCQVCIIGIMSSNPVGDVCNLNWQRQRLYKAANMVGLFSTNIWSWKCSECGIDQELVLQGKQVVSAVSTDAALPDPYFAYCQRCWFPGSAAVVGARRWCVDWFGSKKCWAPVFTKELTDFVFGLVQIIP